MSRIKIDRFYRNIRLNLKDRFVTYLHENYGKNPTIDQKKIAARDYFIRNVKIENTSQRQIDPDKSSPKKLYESITRNI